MPIDARAIEWFRGYSPQEGDPDCKCSWCRQVIGKSEVKWPDDEDDEEDEPEIAIRLWRGSGRKMEEARFHSHCFNDVLQRGILQLKTRDQQ
jgi:hypothetical protein